MHTWENQLSFKDSTPSQLWLRENGENKVKVHVLWGLEEVRLATHKAWAVRQDNLVTDDNWQETTKE